MPKVRSIALAGVRLFFFSNDHDPPHFHAVKSGDWHYRVRFLLSGLEMLERKTGPRTLSAGTRKRLVALVATHRADLLQEWEASRSDG